MKVYRNAGLVSSQNSNTFAALSTSTFSLGSRFAEMFAVWQSFDGELDLFRIFKRTLTQPEIDELFNSGAGA
jgi:hypothetical protein